MTTWDPLRAAKPYPKEYLTFLLGSSIHPQSLSRSLQGKLRASRTFTVSQRKTEISSCKETPKLLSYQQLLKPGDAVLPWCLTTLISLVCGDAARMPSLLGTTLESKKPLSTTVLGVMILAVGSHGVADHLRVVLVGFSPFQGQNSKYSRQSKERASSLVRKMVVSRPSRDRCPLLKQSTPLPLCHSYVSGRAELREPSSPQYLQVLKCVLCMTVLSA